MSITEKTRQPIPECYRSVIPDTLDLAERAEAALHGIANTIDPGDEYMMWFEVYWNNNPPYLAHSGCDVEIAPKFLDNFTQLRVMSGSDRYRNIETGLETSILRYIDPKDGLYYNLYNPNRPWHMGAYQAAGYRPTQEDYVLPATTGIALTALIPRDELGLTPCNDLLHTMARGLEREAIHKDDYAYYPEGGKKGHPFTRPRSGWADTCEPVDEHASGEGAVTAYFGNQIRGLAMWAGRTGDQQSLDFAGKLVRFVMKSNFWGHPADPPLVSCKELGHVDSHFHARCIALRGLLEYGIVSGDVRVLDFVRGAYEQMRNWGIFEIGFIPTWVNNPNRLSMETCFLGDLVALAIKMSDAGLGDYWEDVDRVVRNHLAESQLLNRTEMERIVSLTPEKMPEDAFTGHGGQMTDGGGPTSMQNCPPPSMAASSRQVCYENVLDRCLGIFVSYLLPSGAENGRTMQCCTANAARGLYYAWEGITRFRDENGEVNLLLNRAAPWLDIDSCLPYESKAVIRNKTCRRISIRVPAWTNRGQLCCTVNGTDRRLHFVRNYLVLDEMQPGDVITLEFPMHEQTIHRTAHSGTPAETVYTIRFRGNTVVDISPRDENPMMLPLYQRDMFKLQREAPFKTVTRRVSPIVARW